MNSCSDFRDNICAYIDNELNADERNVFEKHIEVCPECKKELNDMACIIGLCNDLPLKELPEDFSAELHDKLATVASRQDKNIFNIKKSKSFIYTRAIATIAASMLLIFLVGNFYKYGFNIPKGGTDSGLAYNIKGDNGQNLEMYDESTEIVTEEYGIFSLSAKEESTDDTIKQGNGESAPADNHLVTADADRSEAREKSREIAIAGKEQMLKTEAATRKFSTITLLADDPETEIIEIQELALANSAEILDDKEKEPESQEMRLNSLYGSDMADIKIEINLSIQHSRYDSLIDSLKAIYGKADLQIGAFVTEDMSPILEENIAASEEIGNKIDELNKADSSKNAGEIKELYSEKEAVDNQIEAIRMGSDEVALKIFINKK